MDEKIAQLERGLLKLKIDFYYRFRHHRIPQRKSWILNRLNGYSRT